MSSTESYMTSRPLKSRRSEKDEKRSSAGKGGFSQKPKTKTKKK